jgi:hypothetical protein
MGEAKNCAPSEKIKIKIASKLPNNSYFEKFRENLFFLNDKKIQT